MSRDRYSNTSQQRLLKVVLALFADVVQGVSNAALTKATGASASNVTRDLENLRIAGLAERDEATGLWRLTPRLPQQAVKVFSAIDLHAAKVEQARNRFTRTPD
jgi:DNA-binding IclR family transcriptional regulator